MPVLYRLVGEKNFKTLKNNSLNTLDVKNVKNIDALNFEGMRLENIKEFLNKMENDFLFLAPRIVFVPPEFLESLQEEYAYKFNANAMDDGSEMEDEEEDMNIRISKSRPVYDPHYGQKDEEHDMGDILRALDEDDESINVDITRDDDFDTHSEAGSHISSDSLESKNKHSSRPMASRASANNFPLHSRSAYKHTRNIFDDSSSEASDESERVLKARTYPRTPALGRGHSGNNSPIDAAPFPPHRESFSSLKHKSQNFGNSGSKDSPASSASSPLFGSPHHQELGSHHFKNHDSAPFSRDYTTDDSSTTSESPRRFNEDYSHREDRAPLSTHQYRNALHTNRSNAYRDQEKSFSRGHTLLPMPRLMREHDLANSVRIDELPTTRTLVDIKNDIEKALWESAFEPQNKNAYKISIADDFPAVVLHYNDKLVLEAEKESVYVSKEWKDRNLSREGKATIILKSLGIPPCPPSITISKPESPLGKEINKQFQELQNQEKTHHPNFNW